MSSSIFTFYKIVSKNENIKELYVGKTTNFKMRVKDHKRSCYNENRKAYNIKLYKYIRENGGWNNFNFIEIEKGEYNDKDSAFRERYWVENLNANLNSNIPSRTDKELKKEYYEKNIEKIKEYRENNKKIIKEKKKEYYEKNKEYLKEKRKEYYYKNKEQTY
jgi:hypothetical protein